MRQVITFRGGGQCTNEFMPVNVKGFAALVSPELMHQLNSPSPASAEQIFDTAAVYNRRLHSLQLLKYFWKLNRPLTLGGHKLISPALYVSAQLCRTGLTVSLSTLSG